MPGVMIPAGELSMSIARSLDVDLELVWKTVNEDPPSLVVRLEALAPPREP
jgi:hypothetical protein